MAENTEPGMYFNRNAGDPTKWSYEPDLTQPSFSDQFWLSESLRLTWQATPRNKISFSGEDQLRCVGCSQSATVTVSREANQKGNQRIYKQVGALYGDIHSTGKHHQSHETSPIAYRAVSFDLLFVLDDFHVDCYRSSKTT